MTEQDWVAMFSDLQHRYAEMIDHCRQLLAGTGSETSSPTGSPLERTAGPTRVQLSDELDDSESA